MRRGEAPVFADGDEAAVYDYAREMQQTGRISDAIYAEALRRLGTVGVVELTALVGYYTMVAMTLNAHEIPLPDGRSPPLDPPPTGLATLPPAAAPAKA
jgi:4-carboxymuconolactone decarboxylase